MRESARARPTTIRRKGPRHELGTHELGKHELCWHLGRLSQRVLARHVPPCARCGAGDAAHARHLSRSAKARRRGGRDEPSSARWRVRRHSPARASRAFGPSPRLDTSRYGGLDDGAVRQLASRDCPGTHRCFDAHQRSARGPRRRHHRHRRTRRLGPPGPHRRAHLRMDRCTRRVGLRRHVRSGRHLRCARGGRFWALVLDFVLAGTGTFAAVLVPHPHARNLLGGEPPLLFTQPLSMVSLFVLAAGFTALAIARTAP